MTREGKAWVTVGVLGMWTAISCVVGPQLVTRYRLRGRTSVTEGLVISVDAREHNRATYRYQVAGNALENSEIMSHRRVGDLVRVYYDPSNPKVAMLVEPGEGLGSDLLGLGFLYVFFAAGAIWIGARADSLRST